LTLAFGWWAMADLGRSTLTAQPEPIYVAGCPVPDRLDKSSAQGGIGKGGGCSKEGASHPISSRQPGVGPAKHAQLAKYAHGPER
jgi:hypothetical protein